MLNLFHFVVSIVDVGSVRYHAVIREENCIGVLYMRRKRFGHLRSGRGGIRCKGNGAESDDNLGKEAIGQGLAGGRESGGVGRMRMYHGRDVRPFAVDKEMHAKLGRRAKGL